ncbi:XRE family transcriptional regulator [Pseudooceanicola sp. CBS1P-1]|uniref:Helix-turn-helix domain-containing protein n=1 Tax=Pseudooceanicola albus TaxID=2692189 RepID=A0A6L7G5P0_9RHOB|nr:MULTISPECIES: XRE family transcriptional regulator [Pseudooceanicola]MBT9383031.1 XRE family transcriptional regulator [Pseudooceanicola endophyticus]MXN19219.1 helix-turn-helix domain-containing protein [Pseudooceanicola albus]
MGEQTIRTNLRAARDRAGWSLQRTAEITGVSKAMLGQIERGESSPTLATLWKLAKGFHLPLSAFIEDMVETTELFSGREDGQRQFPDGALSVRTVFPFDPGLGSETFVITLAPGQIHASGPHDAGVVEDIFVIEGAVEMVHGPALTLCRTGEGLRFRADVAHEYRNAGPGMARFHNTIHYPRTGLLSGG